MDDWSRIVQKVAGCFLENWALLDIVSAAKKTPKLKTAPQEDAKVQADYDTHGHQRASYALLLSTGIEVKTTAGTHLTPGRSPPDGCGINEQH